MLHVEVGHCDVSQLAGLKQIANMLRGLSDVLKTDVAVRAAELRQVDVNDVVDTTLNPDGRSNPQEELVEKDRGAVLDNLPGMDEATRSGELSAQYADVVAKAVAKLAVDVRAEFYRRHPDLDTIAATRSVQGFRLYVTHLVELLLADLGVQRAERQRHQRRAKIFTEVETGLWGLSGRWDPLTGQTLNTAITAEVNAIYHARRGDNTDLRTREQITADAITNLICNTPVSTRTKVAGVTAIVITRSTRRRPADRTTSRCTSTPMAPRSPSTPCNRCSSDPTTTIVEAEVNEHGVVESLGDAVLNHGRSKRFATPDQKLALRVMHRSCLFPGCDMPFDRCEQHHLVEYQHHGNTDLIDLGPVCCRHHHQLHAHNWKLRLHRDTRALTITYPDGTTRTHPLTGLAPNNDPPGNDPPGESHRRPTKPHRRQTATPHHPPTTSNRPRPATPHEPTHAARRRASSRDRARRTRTRGRVPLGHRLRASSSRGIRPGPQFLLQEQNIGPRGRRRV